MDAIGETVVAKKKEPEETGHGALFVRGRIAWIRYVQRWAEEKRWSPGTLLEVALIELAKAEGREAPPKR